MAGSAARPRQVPEYRLAYEPDGSSVTVRENLVDILTRELLGPVGVSTALGANHNRPGPRELHETLTG